MAVTAVDKQIAKEIMIALIQAGGTNSPNVFFPREKHESRATQTFEVAWATILNTVSAGSE